MIFIMSFFVRLKRTSDRNPAVFARCFTRHAPGLREGMGTGCPGVISTNQTTKYGLFFLGGVVLGAVAVTRGRLDVKPLATDLLSAGIDLKEKALGAVESVREDIADAVAEAQVKSQEKKAKAEEAAAAAAESREAAVQQAVGSRRTSSQRHSQQGGSGDRGHAGEPLCAGTFPRRAFRRRKHADSDRHRPSDRRVLRGGRQCRSGPPQQRTSGSDVRRDGEPEEQRTSGELAVRRNPFALTRAELDFGPLARFVVLRPFLPVIANAANAVLGAVPIVKEGISELLHCRLNVAVLDAAALIVSILRRDFRTAGLLVLLLGMGDMLEKYARKKSMASLAEQLSVKCDRVWVRTPDGLRQKFLETVTRDDVVVVRAGSVIPVDGVVADGEAAVNQASMTGEPLAVARSAGGSVFAGTVVESGEIGISPTGVGDGTRLAKIIKFVEDSEQVKAGIESRALRFADAVVPFNFALAALVWLFTRDLTRTASVLLVDYSCAPRLATPRRFSPR